jgi:hypothetical protein
MPPTIHREPFVKQSVSLRRDQIAAARRVVREEGYSSFSAYLQQLLTDDLRRRFGRDWYIEFQAAGQQGSNGHDH